MLKGHVCHLMLLEQGSHVLILGYNSTMSEEMQKGHKLEVFPFPPNVIVIYHLLENGVLELG